MFYAKLQKLCRTNYTIKITIYEMIDHYTYESMHIHWTGLDDSQAPAAVNAKQMKILFIFGEIWVKSWLGGFRFCEAVFRQVDKIASIFREKVKIGDNTSEVTNADQRAMREVYKIRLHHRISTSTLPSITNVDVIDLSVVGSQMSTNH